MRPIAGSSAQAISTGRGDREAARDPTAALCLSAARALPNNSDRRIASSATTQQAAAIQNSVERMVTRQTDGLVRSERDGRGK